MQSVDPGIVFVPEINAGLANILPPPLQLGGKCSDSQMVSLTGKVWSFAFIMVEMANVRDHTRLKKQCLPEMRARECLGEDWHFCQNTP